MVAVLEARVTRSQTFTGMGGHHSNRPITEEWLTPPAIIDALGGSGSFDLDPATPVVQPYPTARSRYHRLDNGLIRPWFGRVWLNPPYSNKEIGKWLARLAEHGCGCALIFARTETDNFFRYVWERAAGLLFLRGRLNFHYPTGQRASANSGAPSVLCAYGARDAEILAFCGLDGRFVPLSLPRAVVVLGLAGSWSDVLSQWFAAHGRGAVSIDQLYRDIACHPKAMANRHVRAKIRQQLQRGPYERVGRGQWRTA